MTRAHFKIPDKPAERPTVRVVLSGVMRYCYDHPGGGLLHVIVEDRNITDGVIRETYYDADKAGDREAAYHCADLLQMTGSQRRRLCRRFDREFPRYRARCDAYEASLLVRWAKEIRAPVVLYPDGSATMLLNPKSEW